MARFGKPPIFGELANFGVLTTFGESRRVGEFRRVREFGGFAKTRHLNGLVARYGIPSPRRLTHFAPTFPAPRVRLRGGVPSARNVAPLALAHFAQNPPATSRRRLSLLLGRLFRSSAERTWETVAMLLRPATVGAYCSGEGRIGSSFGPICSSYSESRQFRYSAGDFALAPSGARRKPRQWGRKIQNKIQNSRHDTGGRLRAKQGEWRSSSPEIRLFGPPGSSDSDSILFAWRLSRPARAWGISGRRAEKAAGQSCFPERNPPIQSVGRGSA